MKTCQTRSDFGARLLIAVGATVLSANAATAVPFTLSDAALSRVGRVALASPDGFDRSASQTSGTRATASRPDPADQFDVTLLSAVTGQSAQDGDAQRVLATRYALEQRSSESRAVVMQALASDPQSAAAHVSIGKLLMTEGHEEAVKELEQAISLDPARVEAYTTLANCYRLRGDFATAEKTLQRGAAAAPLDRVPPFQLGELYWLQGKKDDALALFVKLSTDGPDVWAAQKRVAELRLERGEIEEAHRRIFELLAISSVDLELHYLNARLLFAKGERDKGTFQLQQVLREGPAFVRARFELARAYARDGKTELAASELAQCLRYEPDFVPARYVLAQLHLQAGQADLAQEQASRVLAAVPRNFDARVMIVDAAFGGRSPDKARQLAQQLVKDDPDRFESHWRLGRALAAAGQFSAALPEFEQALTLNSDAVEVLADLLQVMQAAKRPAGEIVARAQAYAQAHPASAQAQWLLGDVTLASGDRDRGTSILETALQHYPDLLAAHRRLAEVYGARGQLSEARRHVEQLIAQHPSAAAHTLLGLVADAQQQYKDGAQSYKQALELDPDFAPAANNLAWYYAEHEGNPEMALELARQARAALPKDPHVAHTLGWILYKRGHYGVALEHLREGAAQLPSNAVVQSHLALASERHGDRQKAAPDPLRSAREIGLLPPAIDLPRGIGELE